MSGATIDPRLNAARAAPQRRMQLKWSDPKFRAIVWQVVVVAIVVGVVAYLVRNTNRNLAARHIATGFAFLARTAGIPIGEHMVEYDPAISTYGDALIIGILNTLKVAVVGILLATVLGTLIGIGRLSKNWLVARAAAFYVEVLRDIPVLLQLLFWYSVLQALPSVRDAWNPIPGIFLSNRGLKVPLFDWEPAHGWALAAFLVGLIGVIAWSGVANKRQAETGVRPKVWPVAVGLLGGDLPADASRIAHGEQQGFGGHGSSQTHPSRRANHRDRPYIAGLTRRFRHGRPTALLRRPRRRGRWGIFRPDRAAGRGGGHHPGPHRRGDPQAGPGPA